MVNGSYVLLDYGGRPKPTMMAYSALESFLAGTKPVRVTRRGDLSVHLLSRHEGAVAIVWSTRARPLFLPAGTFAFDLMGNEMKQPVLNPGEPIYIRALHLTPADLESPLR